MNKIYTTVWCESRQQWIVTSELTSGAGRPKLLQKKSILALVLGAMLVPSAQVLAVDYVDVTLGGSDVQKLYSGDTATSTVINSGGLQNIYTDGVATETTINSGGKQVVFGGTATGTIVNSGSWQNILSGGIANTTTITDGGTQNIIDGGMATDTTINGGHQNIRDGGTATGTTINGGTQYVSGGTATGTIVNSGSWQLIYGSGFVNTTTITDGGTQNIRDGGMATDTTINGGHQSIVSGTATGTTINGGSQDVGSYGFGPGTATDTTINGGVQYVHSGGMASETLINSGGEQYISGGTATKTIINSGGVQTVATAFIAVNSSGGIARDTTINIGGTQIVSLWGEATNTILNGGVQTLSRGGRAIDTTINSGGSQTISGGRATDTTINSGGSQTIYSGGAAIDTTINQHGQQLVSSGGMVTETTINSGGYQFISSDGTATDTTVNIGGTQSVSSDGTATNTTLNGGGQIVSSGGSASDTIINGGVQLVVGGSAAETIINSDGVQYVSRGSITTDTTINNGGQSWLMTGALADGVTQINTGGEMQMAVGSTAKDVLITGGTLSVINPDNTASGYAPAQVDKLSMNGGSVSFQHGHGEDFAALNISELSGTGNFLFNTSLAERNGNFVTIEQGTGQFGIAVTDSGKEISDHTDLTVNLIHEKGGDIDFEMITASGQSTRAIDGGTYMYTLFSQQNKDGLNGGNVWYLGAMTEEPGGGGENPGGGGENPGGGGENPGGGGENPGGGGENPGGGGENPGGGGENPGGGGENPGGGGENPGGGGENPGGGGENPGGGGENPGGGGENPGGGGENPGGGKKPMTTPATDAILSMSNAGLNVIHSELEGLRMYRASLIKTGPESNVWGHYLGSKNHTDTSNGAAYQLNQNGLEIGADTRTDFEGGSLITGAFMSWSDNQIKHARGGKSSIDSYGLGLYATWFDVSGFYADGVVKGNRLNNKLSAVMTNGGKTSGDWKQYGLSTAVEGGYQFNFRDDVSLTPYARLAFVQMSSEDLKLSNGMKGNTGTPRSVTGEAGAKLSGKFGLGAAEFKPYLSAAIVQEYAGSNEVTINERNRFDNNVKGTSGKYGMGASVNIGKDVTFYGEINYRQGSHTETPVQGVAGIRIGF